MWEVKRLLEVSVKQVSELTQRYDCSGESRLVTFGRGEDGQLGHGTAADQHTPLLVEALRGKDATAVICGAEYTIAVCHGGKEVYSWGWCGPPMLHHTTSSNTAACSEHARMHRARLVARRSAHNKRVSAAIHCAGSSVTTDLLQGRLWPPRARRLQ